MTDTMKTIAAAAAFIGVLFLLAATTPKQPPRNPKIIDWTYYKLGKATPVDSIRPETGLSTEKIS
jgi:hypothetical protein